MRVNGMGISLITLVIIMILTISINTNTQSADTPDYDFYLRELAEKASIKIGFAAVNNFWSMADSEQYMEIAKNEFNILTPENQMKMDSLQPDMDSFNFEQADRHVRFAEENGMDVHGHALVWHNQTPSWLTETNWEKEELDKILKEHIKTVVEHYKGKVKVWDVVNEAFMDDGSYRRSIWYNVLGKEYIEKSFVRAKEIDPDATLIYNDYGIGSINNKSN
ncbi:MAG: endo-1,4-beta-xylanase, partial [Halanaerobiaceae bacterium]